MEPNKDCLNVMQIDLMNEMAMATENNTAH